MAILWSDSTYHCKATEVNLTDETVNRCSNAAIQISNSKPQQAILREAKKSQYNMETARTQIYTSITQILLGQESHSNTENERVLDYKRQF